MRTQGRSALRRTLLSGVMLGVLSLAVLPSLSASAAGSGYGQGPPPPSATEEGFTRIVTSQTLTPSGGSLQGVANGATVSVIVPRGSLPNGGQVVVSTGAPKKVKTGRGDVVVADFSIVVIDPTTGAKLKGVFRPAIIVILLDRSIVARDFVVTVAGPDRVSRVTTARVTKGEVVATFTRDPNFEVVRRR